MSRSAGRVLVVGSAACRAHVRATLARVPFEFAAADDPYAAALELSRRPLAYRAVVLCLNSVYREELGLISHVKARLGHVDVFLSQTDGRQAATVEAMRRGADGLLGDDGLHRFSDMDATALSRVRGGGGPIVPAAEANGNGAAPPGAGPQAAASSVSVPNTTGPTETPSQRSPGQPFVTTPAEVDDALAAEPVLTADELRALLQEEPTVPPIAGSTVHEP